jgi:hypothetical protein
MADYREEEERNQQLSTGLRFTLPAWIKSRKILVRRSKDPDYIAKLYSSTPDELEESILTLKEMSDYINSDPMNDADNLLRRGIEAILPEQTQRKALGEFTVASQIHFGFIPEQTCQLAATFQVNSGRGFSPKLQHDYLEKMSLALGLELPSDGFAGLLTSDNKSIYTSIGGYLAQPFGLMGTAYCMYRALDIVPVPIMMEAERVREGYKDELTGEIVPPDPGFLGRWVDRADNTRRINQNLQDAWTPHVARLFNVFQTHPDYEKFCNSLILDSQNADRDVLSTETQELLGKIAQSVVGHEDYHYLVDLIKLGEIDERAATEALNGKGVAELNRKYRIPPFLTEEGLRLLNTPILPVFLEEPAETTNVPAEEPQVPVTATITVTTITINTAIEPFADTGYYTLSNQGRATKDALPLFLNTRSSITKIIEQMTKLSNLPKGVTLEFLDPNKAGETRTWKIFAPPLFDPEITKEPPVAKEVVTLISTLVAPFIEVKMRIGVPTSSDDTVAKLFDLVQMCRDRTFPMIFNTTEHGIVTNENVFTRTDYDHRNLYCWMMTDIIRQIIAYFLYTDIDLDRVAEIAGDIEDVPVPQKQTPGLRSYLSSTAGKLRAYLPTLNPYKDKMKDFKPKTISQCFVVYLDELMKLEERELEAGFEFDTTRKSQIEAEDRIVRYLELLRKSDDISEEYHKMWSFWKPWQRLEHCIQTTEGQKRLAALFQLGFTAVGGIIAEKFIRNPKAGQRKLTEHEEGLSGKLATVKKERGDLLGQAPQEFKLPTTGNTVETDPDVTLSLAFTVTKDFAETGDPEYLAGEYKQKDLEAGQYIQWVKKNQPEKLKELIAPLRSFPNAPPTDADAPGLTLSGVPESTLPKVEPVIGAAESKLALNGVLDGIISKGQYIQSAAFSSKLSGFSETLKSLNNELDLSNLKTTAQSKYAEVSFQEKSLFSAAANFKTAFDDKKGKDVGFLTLASMKKFAKIFLSEAAGSATLFASALEERMKDSSALPYIQALLGNRFYSLGVSIAYGVILLYECFQFWNYSDATKPINFIPSTSTGSDPFALEPTEDRFVLNKQEFVTPLFPSGSMTADPNARLTLSALRDRIRDGRFRYLTLQRASSRVFNKFDTILSPVVNAAVRATFGYSTAVVTGLTQNTYVIPQILSWTLSSDLLPFAIQAPGIIILLAATKWGTSQVFRLGLKGVNLIAANSLDVEELEKERNIEKALTEGKVIPPQLEADIQARI